MNNMAHLRGALPPGLRPGAAPPPPPPGMAPPPGIFAGRPKTGPGAPPPGVNVSREQLAAQAQFNRRGAAPSVLPGALSRAGGHGSLLAQYADPDAPAPPPMPASPPGAMVYQSQLSFAVVLEGTVADFDQAHL